MIEKLVWTEEQRAVILEEMNRILADPTFKSSKRCQGMLVRLIDHALAGDLNGLKERTLGVEAFGRDPNYDTNTDPIVRTTATEIRKRLAQWYGEPNRHHAVRIRLVPGSYLPEFDFDLQDQSKEITEEKTVVEPDPLSILGQPTSSSVLVAPPAVTTHSRGKRALWGTAILLAIIAVGVAFWSRRSPSKEQMIWQPFLETTKPLTLSIADTDSQVGSNVTGDMHWQTIANALESREAPRNVSRDTQGNFPQNVSLLDARVAQKISIFLGAHGSMPVLRASSALDIGDFHRGPIVLIGAFNPWSVVLLSNPNLRYGVRVDPTNHDIWIRDAQNPMSRDWKIDGNADHHNLDYAVITRFFDNETNEWVYGLCGLWSFGTEAAANLLVEPEFIRFLPDSLRGAKNFQIVIKTSTLNGNTGIPQILSIYTW
jgi:hypothetical protein